MQSESIDQQLHEFALAAKAAPPGSRARQRALTEICQILRQPGLLRRRSNIREDLWKEARQVVMVYICEKIDNYNPQKGTSFLAWVNTHLKWRQQDLEKGRNSPDYISLENLISSASRETGEKSAWEEFIESENSKSEFLSVKLKNLFEDDPDDEFAAAHVKGRPDVTFQILVLRGLYGTPYREMAEQTGVSVSTLSSFYQRRLAEFSPYIREYLMND
jgi:DNA-directed RNA polymerase specialized sigma24 family protein